MYALMAWSAAAGDFVRVTGWASSLEAAVALGRVMGLAWDCVAHR